MINTYKYCTDNSYEWNITDNKPSSEYLAGINGGQGCKAVLVIR